MALIQESFPVAHKTGTIETVCAVPRFMRRTRPHSKVSARATLAQSTNSAARCSNRSHMSLTLRSVIETKDYDLSGYNFCWPEDRRKASRYSNFLPTIRDIGDHTTANRAADLLTP